MTSGHRWIFTDTAPAQSVFFSRTFHPFIDFLCIDFLFLLERGGGEKGRERHFIRIKGAARVAAAGVLWRQRFHPEFQWRWAAWKCFINIQECFNVPHSLTFEHKISNYYLKLLGMSAGWEWCYDRIDFLLYSNYCILYWDCISYTTTSLLTTNKQ